MRRSFDSLRAWLLIDTSSENLQNFMQRVAAAGSRYGLQFEWTKIEALHFHFHSYHLGQLYNLFVQSCQLDQL